LFLLRLSRLNALLAQLHVSETQNTNVMMMMIIRERSLEIPAVYYGGKDL